MSDFQDGFWEQIYIACLRGGLSNEQAFLRANVAYCDRIRASNQCANCDDPLATHSGPEGRCVVHHCGCMDWEARD